MIAMLKTTGYCDWSSMSLSQSWADIWHDLARISLVHTYLSNTKSHWMSTTCFSAKWGAHCTIEMAKVIVNTPLWWQASLLVVVSLFAYAYWWIMLHIALRLKLLNRTSWGQCKNMRRYESYLYSMQSVSLSYKHVEPGWEFTSRQIRYKWQQVWLCKSQKGLDDSCIKRTSKVICRQVEYVRSCVYYTCIMHRYQVSGCGVCLFVVVQVVIIKRNAFIHSYGKALDIIAHILINISTQLHTGNYNPIIRSAIVCWRIGQV